MVECRAMNRFLWSRSVVLGCVPAQQISFIGIYKHCCPLLLLWLQRSDSTDNGHGFCALTQGSHLYAGVPLWGFPNLADVCSGILQTHASNPSLGFSQCPVRLPYSNSEHLSASRGTPQLQMCDADGSCGSCSMRI